MTDIVAVTVTRSWTTAAMDIGSRSPITAIRTVTPMLIRRIRHTDTSGLTGMIVTDMTVTIGRATTANDIIVRAGIIDADFGECRTVRRGKRRLPQLR